MRLSKTPPLLLLLGLGPAVFADLPTLADSTTTYYQDFDALVAVDSAVLSTLPDGWTVVETGKNANAYYNADNGSKNSGNTYSYGVSGSTDRALGTLASGSLVSRLEFRLVNGSGLTVDSVAVSFHPEQWRQGSSAIDSLGFSWAVGSGTATVDTALTLGPDNNTLDGAAGSSDSAILSSVLPVHLAAGDTLVLAWTDVNVTGNDDGWAVDDFSLRFVAFATDSGSETPDDTTGTDTTTVPVDTTSGLVLIHAIQGSDSASPLVGQSVAFVGIVTSVGAKGYFVQSPDDRTDADSLTSEGLYVYANKTPEVVSGDSVRIDGTVAEYNGLTEITSPTATVLASGAALPTAARLALPLASRTVPEPLEGMLVTVRQPLTVTNNYVLARYGCFTVASRGRLLSPTQGADPGTAALTAQAADALDTLVVNDGSTTQNPSTVPYPAPGLSAENPLRTGARLDSLQGALTWANSAWTLEPTVAPAFLDANPRAAAPARPENAVRVASFNVLNYFTTLGTSALCGPDRDLACRGASDSTEFRRQKSKIVSALKALDADVYGLMEIENHPTDSALADLVQGLGDSTQAGAWDYVRTSNPGGDAIRVALIYRVASVSPEGTAAHLTSSVDTLFVDTLNRVPVAQTFRDLTSGELFTVVVNHLKSKGSSCEAAGDPDAGDGQGNCSGIRSRAAQALGAWALSRPTGETTDNVLLIGDLNAYGRETPVRILEDSGFVELIRRDLGDSAWTYQYGGSFGVLDHALASATLAPDASVAIWHINADEPTALGYNTEYKSTAQITSFFSPDPWASSDHDPVVIDLAFDGGTTGLSKTAAAPLSASLIRRGGHQFLRASGAEGGSFSLVGLDGRRLGAGSIPASGLVDLGSLGSGVYLVRLRSLEGRSATLALPAR